MYFELFKRTLSRQGTFYFFDSLSSESTAISASIFLDLILALYKSLSFMYVPSSVIANTTTKVTHTIAITARINESLNFCHPLCCSR